METLLTVDLWSMCRYTYKELLMMFADERTLHLWSPVTIELQTDLGGRGGDGDDDEPPQVFVMHAWVARKSVTLSTMIKWQQIADDTVPVASVVDDGSQRASSLKERLARACAFMQQVSSGSATLRMHAIPGLQSILHTMSQMSACYGALLLSTSMPYRTLLVARDNVFTDPTQLMSCDREFFHRELYNLCGAAAYLNVTEERLVEWLLTRVALTLDPDDSLADMLCEQPLLPEADKSDALVSQWLMKRATLQSRERVRGVWMYSSRLNAVRFAVPELGVDVAYRSTEDCVGFGQPFVIAQSPSGDECAVVSHTSVYVRADLYRFDWRSAQIVEMGRVNHTLMTGTVAWTKEGLRVTDSLYDVSEAGVIGCRRAPATPGPDDGATRDLLFYTDQGVPVYMREADNPHTTQALEHACHIYTEELPPRAVVCKATVWTLHNDSNVTHCDNEHTLAYVSGDQSLMHETQRWLRDCRAGMYAKFLSLWMRVEMMHSSPLRCADVADDTRTSIVYMRDTVSVHSIGTVCAQWPMFPKEVNVVHGYSSTAATVVVGETESAVVPDACSSLADVPLFALDAAQDLSTLPPDFVRRQADVLAEEESVRGLNARALDAYASGSALMPSYATVRVAEALARRHANPGVQILASTARYASGNDAVTGVFVRDGRATAVHSNGSMRQLGRSQWRGANVVSARQVYRDAFAACFPRRRTDSLAYFKSSEVVAELWYRSSGDAWKCVTLMENTGNTHACACVNSTVCTRDHIFVVSMLPEEDSAERRIMLSTFSVALDPVIQGGVFMYPVNKKERFRYSYVMDNCNTCVYAVPFLHTGPRGDDVSSLVNVLPKFYRDAHIGIYATNTSKLLAWDLTNNCPLGFVDTTGEVFRWTPMNQSPSELAAKLAELYYRRHARYTTGVVWHTLLRSTPGDAAAAHPNGRVYSMCQGTCWTC